MGKKSTKSRTAETKRLNFFKLTHPISYILIPVPLLSLLLSVHAPTWITWHFGPLGQLALYLAVTYPSVMYYISLLTQLIHVSEGSYSFYLCWKYNFAWIATLKWTIQTTFMGVFSLGILLKYIRKQQKKQ